MKKFLSVILALVLVLSLGTVAFAEGGVKPAAIPYDVAPVVPKTYVVNNGTAPAETFTFSFEGVSYKNGDGNLVENPNIPAIGDVTIAYDAITTKTDKTVALALNANDYQLGVYTYEVTETVGSTAGVTYSNEALYLVLTILRDEENGKHYVAAMHYESATGTDKATGFTNKYDAGSLSVTKEITGNMAEMSKKFAFTIVFTAPADKTVKSAITVTKPDQTTETITFAEGATSYTYKISLGDGETVKFDNLPVGVTYAVSENAENYTSDGGVFSDENMTISAGDADTVVFTNNLTTEIDTGISLDSMPYVVLLTVAVLGVAVVLTKKRIAE